VNTLPPNTACSASGTGLKFVRNSLCAQQTCNTGSGLQRGHTKGSCVAYSAIQGRGAAGWMQASSHAAKASVLVAAQPGQRDALPFKLPASLPPCKLGVQACLCVRLPSEGIQAPISSWVPVE